MMGDTNVHEKDENNTIKHAFLAGMLLHCDVCTSVSSSAGPYMEVITACSSHIRWYERKRPEFVRDSWKCCQDHSDEEQEQTVLTLINS